MDDWNKTGLVFTEISIEASREYTFPGGDRIVIKNPTHLNVSSSGGHRVKDAAGNGYYIPAGFISIKWVPRDGQPTFVA